MNLDEIRAAADAKYGPFPIEFAGGTVTLLAPLRLPEKKREQLSGLLAQTENDGLLDRYREVIRLAAKPGDPVAPLIKDIGDDIGVLAELINEYGRRSQVGEASPSAG
jgi:hypothetical protein